MTLLKTNQALDASTTCTQSVAVPVVAFNFERHLLTFTAN
jgi:hypothetical protein